MAGSNVMMEWQLVLDYVSLETADNAGACWHNVVALAGTRSVRLRYTELACPPQ